MIQGVKRQGQKMSENGLIVYARSETAGEPPCKRIASNISSVARGGEVPGKWHSSDGEFTRIVCIYRHIRRGGSTGWLCLP